MSINVLQSPLFSRQKKKLHPVRNGSPLGDHTEMPSARFRKAGGEALPISNGVHKNQIRVLDEEIKKLVEDPKVGEQKKGDLKEVWVHKFKADSQLFLLAYQWDSKKRYLVAIHPHENFYRDLKKYLK